MGGGTGITSKGAELLGIISCIMALVLAISSIPLEDLQSYETT